MADLIRRFRTTNGRTVSKYRDVWGRSQYRATGNDGPLSKKQYAGLARHSEERLFPPPPGEVFRSVIKDTVIYAPTDTETELTVWQVSEEEIDMSELRAKWEMAIEIAVSAGRIIPARLLDPTKPAVEDNERIDHDEVRPVDGPLGEPNGTITIIRPWETYEYGIVFSRGTLTEDGGGIEPPL